MNHVISSEKIPIKLWLNDLEDGALEQAKNIANLPFAFKHVAIMPDAHQGYGMPIGGVLAAKGIVIPNAVGMDIGCGMAAARMHSYQDIDDDVIKFIMNKIRQEIPLGFQHRKEVEYKKIPGELCDTVKADTHPLVASQNQQGVLKQLGTLGGGNHFIELQRDQGGFWWIMVHSGSRNIGKRVAVYHNKIAKKLNEKWYSSIPANQDLAFLPIESKEAKQYIAEMKWCVWFAQINRSIMINTIIDIFDEVISKKFNPVIDVAHNYATWENHFNQNVMIHRKGATSAKNCEKIIIPGSQGTNSYIGLGLGNKDSFNSCSHGAGRKLSRTKAKKDLILADEIKLMEDKGIIHSLRDKSNLDEASGAYKDIEEVMNNQADLVSITHTLEPKAVIKG